VGARAATVQVSVDAREPTVGASSHGVLFALAHQLEPAAPHRRCCALGDACVGGAASPLLGELQSLCWGRTQGVKARLGFGVLFSPACVLYTVPSWGECRMYPNLALWGCPAGCLQ